DRQERVAKEVVAQFGFRADTWRLDPTEHPFASGAGVDDIRITTNYDPQTMKSFFSTMHEYGHGLYSHQLPRHLERLPTGSSCSLGIHESQSRLWENLVGRSPQFWRFFYPRVEEPPELRASADEVLPEPALRFVDSERAGAPGWQSLEMSWQLM